MAISNRQAEDWVARLQSRLPEVFTHPNPRQVLAEQYALLFLLNRALEGEVTFIGAPIVEEQHE